jgi:hypothetical protein
MCGIHHKRGDSGSHRGCPTKYSHLLPTLNAETEVEQLDKHAAAELHMKDITNPEVGSSSITSSCIISPTTYLMDTDDPNWAGNYSRWCVGLGPKDVYKTGRKYCVPEDHVFWSWSETFGECVDWNGRSDAYWAITNFNNGQEFGPSSVETSDALKKGPNQTTEDRRMP